jgi:hypothetical protein
MGPIDKVVGTETAELAEIGDIGVLNTNVRNTEKRRNGVFLMFFSVTPFLRVWQLEITLRSLRTLR